MPIPIIGVMGPGEQSTLVDQQLADQLGERIAQSGWVLLTGGRNCGVMEAANRGAKRAQGLTVGILPSCDRRSLSAAVDIPILTDLGNARNAINVLSSDVVIACGMGAGTASEVALALKAAKPVILLNVTPIGQAFFQSLTQERVIVADTVEETIAWVNQLLRGDRER